MKMRGPTVKSRTPKQMFSCILCYKRRQETWVWKCSNNLSIKALDLKKLIATWWNFTYILISVEYVIPKIRKYQRVQDVLDNLRYPIVNILKVKCHEASNEISHQCLWSQFYSLLFTTPVLAIDESQTAAAISRREH